MIIGRLALNSFVIQLLDVIHKPPSKVIRNPGLTAAIPFARTSIQLRRYWRSFSNQRGVSKVCLRSKTWMKVRFNDR
jgi:hypothetical protein